jgi:ParB-like chromosome segregation protein Spo0J
MDHRAGGKVKIATIRIGERHRKDLGDLQPLADSIAAEGLLQPIGITATAELVFGERRLKACELLGWTEISTRIVNVTSIAAGEYAENEMRKDFTASERVAIAKAVREEIGNRQGKRTELQSNRSEVSGKQSRQMAAEHSGFGSATSLARAEKVVERGIPELVEAMDRGDVSLNSAANVADLPKPQQREVLKNGNGAAQAIARPSSLSRRASYKHPAIKLENVANTLEVLAEGLTTLDAKRLAEIPVADLTPFVDRITTALSDIRRSLNGITKRVSQ